jgi:hypothetical protein
VHTDGLAEVPALARAHAAELLLKEVIQRPAARVVGLEVLHHLNEDAELDALGVRLDFPRLRRQVVGAAREEDDAILLDRRDRRVHARRRRRVVRRRVGRFLA